MDKLWVRNPYALTKVNISKATPTSSTVIPERAILSLKFLNMFVSHVYWAAQKY